MKWWFRLCDRVVELVTQKSNNAGNFKFRRKCRGVWYGFWTVVTVAAHFCPVEWMIVFPAIIIFLTIFDETFNGKGY